MSAVGASITDDANQRSLTSSASRFAVLRSANAIVPLLAAAITLAVTVAIVAPYPVGIFHDDGVYLILAKSIASGDGYRYLHLPGAPVAAHYPPAYPIFLALLSGFGSSLNANVAVLLLANAALLAFATWAFARFVQSTLGWPALPACMLALASTLSLPLLFLASLVLSEVLFVALLIPLLAACERAATRERRRARLFALGAMVGGLALVRTHGLALAVALLFAFAIRREWRRAVSVLAGVVAVLAPWQLWVAVHARDVPTALRGSYGSYLGWFVEGVKDDGLTLLVKTVTRNVSEIAGILADRFAPWPAGLWRVLLVAAIAGLCVLGATRLRRRAPVTVAFIAAYLVVTLIWPYAPWRFIWGLWPLLLLLVVEGAIGIVTWQAPKLPTLVRLPAAALVAIILGGAVRAELAAYQARAWSSPVRDATRHIAPEMRWISHNARPHETVIADAEPLVYLYTDRRAAPPVAFTASEYVASRSLAADTAALSSIVRASSARFVVTIVPTTIAAARALSAPAQGRGFVLRQADTIDGGAVFEVVRE